MMVIKNMIIVLLLVPVITFSQNLEQYKYFLHHTDNKGDNLFYYRKNVTANQFDLCISNSKKNKCFKNINKDQTIILENESFIIDKNGTYVYYENFDSNGVELVGYQELYLFKKRLIGKLKDNNEYVIMDYKLNILTNLIAENAIIKPAIFNGLYFTEKHPNNKLIDLKYYDLEKKQIDSITSYDSMATVKEINSFLTISTNTNHLIIDLINRNRVIQMDDFSKSIKYINSISDSVLVIKTNNKVENTQNIKPDYEIWDTSEKLLYTDLSKKEILTNSSESTFVFNSVKNRRVEIPNFDHVNSMYAKNQLYFLGLDKDKWFTYSKYHKEADVYVYDFIRNEKELIIEKFELLPNSIVLSPYSRKFLYFKDKDWYCYDVDQRKSFNLTQGNLIFEEEDKYRNDQSLIKPYWLSDKMSVLIIHRNKAFIIDLNKNKILYKFDEDDYNKIALEDTFYNADRMIDIDKNIYLVGYRDVGSTIFKLQNYSLINVLDHEMKNYNLLPYSKGFYNIVEDNLIYPSIQKYTLKSKNIKVIYKNKENNYELKKPLFVSFIDSSGVTFKGILYFPKNYNPKKIYPTVFHIYDKQSHLYNNFLYHNYGDDKGLNLLHLLNNGYMVFLPDLHFIDGIPAISAVNSLNKYIDYFKENLKSVDSNKLGIIGISFGGYLTNFIVGNNSNFKAAVSGSGISNLVSFYNSINNAYNMPRFSMLEDNQLRMKSSFYDDKMGYFNQNPIHFSDKVNTPLLLWAGKNDNHVDWNNSLEMFLSLKRLDKPAKLILFTDENHVLKEDKNKRVLRDMALEWFNSYLK
ncbi:alpha/beta hydrolase family protein [Empedobacter falsenii]|uniref:Prolyl oligopeptidase family serine peptidase n=1 Tax=Empedobacter falsenii TaxID=343874 RepID=A0AAW7DJT9_9FLAO|nr:prolyl oligopeptidase family serine peptidase [Empedobacter falsenii]MDM1551192.1 prolyl oligopeptidase family serine peptidase [Empedobacter falsenii]